MATSSQRFGIINACGARSHEWVVMWKNNTNDVYLATRTLGGSMKASFHASGKCHVQAPNHQSLHNTPLSKYILKWEIDSSINFCFPFSVLILEQELRADGWQSFKEKGTVWLPIARNKVMEIAVFFIRSSVDQSSALQQAGWRHHLVNVALLDGRRLIVAAGEIEISQEKLIELDVLKTNAKNSFEEKLSSFVSPKLIFLANQDSNGTPKFIEAALN